MTVAYAPDALNTLRDSFSLHLEASRAFDFDAGLLGGDHEQYWLDRRPMGHRFVASGELAKDPNSPWVGVLAFYDVGVFRASEPVLYLSPHSDRGCLEHSSIQTVESWPCETPNEPPPR